jgi:hypothetical protein
MLALSSSQFGPERKCGNSVLPRASEALVSGNNSAESAYRELRALRHDCGQAHAVVRLHKVGAGLRHLLERHTARYQRIQSSHLCVPKTLSELMT